MIAGEFHNSQDPELVKRRVQAHDLCQALNSTSDSERELRRTLLRKLFRKGADSVQIQPPFYCDYGSNIELGENVYFNFNCIVLDVCSVRIGEHSQFGSGVQILTPLHPLEAHLRREVEYGAPVVIGADVWVGAGALLLPGVTIGPRTVIGAGSVVSRSLPEDVLAVGNPCRIIRHLEKKK